VEAVARELARRDVVTEVTGLRAFSNEISDEVAELPLRVRNVLAAVQQRRKLSALVLMGNERIGFEHGLQPLGSISGPVANVRQLFQVAADLTFVPRDQDCFDV